MTKRTNQTERTRRAIVDAATELFLGDASPEDLTMQAVADSAGVSHRTLYRYYPSRKELINALGEALEESDPRPEWNSGLSSFDAWVSSVSQSAEVGVVKADLLGRAVAFSAVTGVWRTNRDDAYWALFREEFPHLDEKTARQDFAVLRSVLWAAGTMMMRDRFELTAREAIGGVERAVAVLVDAIRERDGLAAKELRAKA